MSAVGQERARQDWLDVRLRPVRGRMRAAVCCGVGATLAFVVFAAALAALVGRWITADSPSGLAAGGPLLLMMLAALLARSALLAARDACAARAGVIVRANARSEVLAALERLGPLRRSVADDGALAALAVEQVDALDGYVARYWPQRYVAMLVPLALWLCVLPRSWLAAMLLLCTAPLIPVFMSLVGRGAARASQLQAAALARLGAQFLDLLRGLPTLRLLASADAGAARLAASAGEYRERALAVFRLAFLSSAVLELFASIGIALVALYLGLALLGRFDLGHYGQAMRLHDALFVLLLAPEFYAPLRQLGSDYHARADALAAAAAIDTLCAAAPAIGAAGTIVPADAPPVIEFDSVSLRYPDGRVALHEVSFRIGAGERIALRGASGSGKSSLLALLAGFVAPSAGTIRIDGVDLAQLDRAAWWRRLAWLEQRPEWFRRPVRDNVLLGLEAADDARLWSALRCAGLADDVAALPRGADSVPGEADGSLSGGQLQRLALARALAREAQLWLLDEPLAHLDPATAAHLRDSLIETSRGRTLLLATHSEADTPWVDRVLVLERGRLRDGPAAPHEDAVG